MMHICKEWKNLGIFLDSGFFVGLSHPDDPNHAKSLRILRKISTGEYGLIYTSSFVIAESTLVLLIRTNINTTIVEKLREKLYGPQKFVEILPWNASLERRCWDLFLNHNQTAKNKKEILSFVDASSIILCQELLIKEIVAFDGDFDPYLHKIT